MDINVTLANIKRLIGELREASWEMPGESTLPANLTIELCEAFEALDGWLSNGGCLPEDWATFNGRRSR